MTLVDTIRAGITTDHTEGEGCPKCAAHAALDEYVAVGERDKAEIETLRDRAVCSGCGSDVDESGGCDYPSCDDGEMIPASDLPSALRAKCDQRVEEQDEWRDEWDELEAERERDRRQIAQLTEALAVFVDPGNWSRLLNGSRREWVWFGPALGDVLTSARGVLADKEDANG